MLSISMDRIVRKLWGICRNWRVDRTSNTGRLRSSNYIQYCRYRWNLQWWSHSSSFSMASFFWFQICRKLQARQEWTI